MFEAELRPEGRVIIDVRFRDNIWDCFDSRVGWWVEWRSILTSRLG